MASDANALKLVLAAEKGDDAKVKRLLKAKVDIDVAVSSQSRKATVWAPSRRCRPPA